MRVNDGEAELQLDPLQRLGTPNIEDSSGEIIANYRGVGLADMVAAIHEQRPHRCNGELALHVVDVLTSIMRSADEGEFVTLATQCERPDALGESEAGKLLRS